MKKILSLILAIAMLLTVIPAVAENGTEEKGGLQSLLDGLGESGGGNKEGTATGEDNGQIMALLGSLLGGSTGNGTEGGGEEPDWDALLAAWKESDEYKDALGRRNALALHLNEVFPGLAAGDEQVIAMSEVFKFGESDPNVEFGRYVLANYKKSENGKELTMVSAGGAVELITYEKREDGTFKVAGAITAPDGSSMFESMVKGMCDRYGVTYEDYISAMKWQKFNEVFFLLEFMSDHPEYERIEYNGAMVTAKELDEMQNKMYEETVAALEAETGAAQ